MKNLDRPKRSIYLNRIATFGVRRLEPMKSVYKPCPAARPCLSSREFYAWRGTFHTMKPDLPVEYLKECLDYNPDTGIFTWKERPRDHFKTYCAMRTWNSRSVGRITGGNHNKGYRRISLSGKVHLAHRLAWAIATLQWPRNQIDHINGDKADNRLVNLREATNMENCMNMKTTRRNTSGVKGVYWDSWARKWRAEIRVYGKKIYLGKFENLDEAEKIIWSVRMREHGVFANKGNPTLTPGDLLP